MIGTVLGLLSIVYGGLDTISDDRVETLKKDWFRTLNSIKGNKYRNDMDETYELIKVIPRVYGFDCIVGIPYGLSYENFEDLIPTIKTNLKCVNVISEEKETSGVAFVKLINKPFSEKNPFEPIKVKPWEVYLGTTDSYTDICVDMRTHPHVVISGATGTGKSVLMFMILLNMIINHSFKDVNIYISQLTDKQDERIFRNAKHVKCYSIGLEESVKMFSYIHEEMGKRHKLISRFDDINNLFQYNKKFPSKKLPYIYVFLDEFGFYMDEDDDTPSEEYMKSICRSLFKRLAKLGRSAGIFLITGLQRPDRENMPPIFKAQLNVKVAYRQNNGASSLVVLDDYSAEKLPDRVSIIDFGGKRFRTISPYCDEILIKTYLSEYEFDNEREKSYIDVSKYDYIVKKAKTIKKKSDKKKSDNQEKEFDNKSGKSKGRGIL